MGIFMKQRGEIKIYYFLIQALFELKKNYIFISPLSLYNLSGCGLPLLGDIKHLLEKQTSGFAFLFLLLHRVPGIRSLDDLCSCFGVVWINGSNTNLPFVRIPVSRTCGAPRQCSVGEIESRCAGTAKPVFPAVPFLGTGAGAEQWYMTIAKLMQGRNANIPHSLANLRCGGGTPVPLRHPQNEIVATWLILPVVICLS